MTSHQTEPQSTVTNIAQVPIKALTFNQLQKVADEKGHTVEELAEEVIQHYLQREAEQKMKAEMEAFRRLHATLWANYPHQYVAIYQGVMVDHDPDGATLWSRLEQTYPHEVVLIRQVTPEIDRVFRVRHTLSKPISSKKPSYRKLIERLFLVRLGRSC